MKIFLDTANIDQIKKFNELGIVDGVTTNPSLISNEGKDIYSIIQEICNLIDGPISVEVISTELNKMIEEAKKLSKINKNIVIKVPIIESGLKVIKKLTADDIKVNATLCFSVGQALLAMKAGATYVSPFIGRLDDIGHSGISLVKDILEVITKYNFATQIIVASVRHPQHIIEAAKLGAHISTVPPNILEKVIRHPLTDIGLKKFLDDWERSNLRL